MNSNLQFVPLSRWLRGIEAGENEAITALWERYYPDLVRFAEQRMVRLGVGRRVADGEDVAASALGSFFRAVQQKRFHDVNHGEGLLRFLFKITIWKVIDRKRRQVSKPEVGESALIRSAEPSMVGVAAANWNNLSPDLLAEMEEQLERRFAELQDVQLREMARYRFEGYENSEIALMTGCSLATVERRFRLIREIWATSAEREEAE